MLNWASSAFSATSAVRFVFSVSSGDLGGLTRLIEIRSWGNWLVPNV